MAGATPRFTVLPPERWHPQPVWKKKLAVPVAYKSKCSSEYCSLVFDFQLFRLPTDISPQVKRCYDLLTPPPTPSRRWSVSMFNANFGEGYLNFSGVKVVLWRYMYMQMDKSLRRSSNQGVVQTRRRCRISGLVITAHLIAGSGPVL